MSAKKREDDAPEFENNLPTNHYAATRDYCTKHGRAKLDIGGEKQCVKCIEERRTHRQEPGA